MVNKGQVCARCGKPLDGLSNREVATHHIIPLSEGGKDEPGNIELLCKPCHGKVHYWSGKVDEPPKRPSDKAIRLSIDTYLTLDSFRLKGESFNNTVNRILAHYTKILKVATKEEDSQWNTKR